VTFSILQPDRILFGRGTAAQAPALARGFGPRGLVVHGASAVRAAWLLKALARLGVTAETIGCAGEPTLADLDAALARARQAEPDWVLAIGGGAAIDLGKVVAALVPAPGSPLDHLEVVGRGLPLAADPLPFLALPTTAGTGAEVTKNAVIGLPEHGRKVSLRDDRMIARVAVVDPALTDGCPRAVTLASGLDALAQVIEPFVSCRATPYTDALTRGAIGPGLAALVRLMEGEDPAARDAMAWCSLTGGLALANGGLGAVHGLAGVIGGRTGAAHGAICGVLLGPTLAVNRALTSGAARQRIDEACASLAAVLGGTDQAAPRQLAELAATAGLPRLADFGLHPSEYPGVAEAALSASSTAGNPVPLAASDLVEILQLANSMT